MDDFTGFADDIREVYTMGIQEDVKKDDDSSMNWLVVVIHTIVFAVLVHFCRKCCGQRAAAPNNDVELTANLEDLQPKKQLVSCFMLWWIGGIVGAHHFYLERLIHGFLATWTCNFCLMGWLLDLFLLPSYVRDFNTRRTAKDAPPDGSRRRLLIRLPLMSLTINFTILLIGFRLPWMLHKAGVVDIDRLAAQTERNPYDVLEIPQGANLQEAKSAYRKLSLKWHPDRNQNCGKECDDKMSEITKSFELIKKRRAPVSEDKTWMNWFEELGRDWWLVLEVLTQKWSKDAKDTEKRNPRESTKTSEL